MKITIVGAGNMGGGLVKQLTSVGHQVRITARNFSSAQTLAASYPSVIAVTASEALNDSQIIILATGYNDAVSALKALGSLEGRIVIDITNPLTADFMGLTVGFKTSAAEEIARALPEAVIVKAFNTVLAQVLIDGPSFVRGETVPVFYAGDDENAKKTVHELIGSIGFKPVDAGGLKNARYLEHLAGLNIYFAYGAGMGTQITPTWINRT